MAAPQLSIRTDDPSQAVTINAPAPPDGAQRYQKKLRGLAIAELVFGCVCIIFGSVIAGIIATDNNDPDYYKHYFSSYSYGYYPYHYYYYDKMFTTGEGIWCGIWIIVAGAIGIRAGKVNASRCLVSCHLTFSIIGSLFTGIMFIMGVVIGMQNENFTEVLVVYSLLCAGALASLVLLLISSGLSCAALGCCCNSQPRVNAGYGGQVVHSAQPAAAVGVPTVMYTQNTALQGVPTLPYATSYIVQSHPATIAPHGTFAHPSVIQPHQTIVNQPAQNLPLTEKNISEGFPNANTDLPPSYGFSEGAQ